MISIKQNILDNVQNIKNISLDFDKTSCIVNYDIKLQNIIFNKKGSKRVIKCIIDWDNPIIGLPTYNIAKTERHLITDYCLNLNDSYFDYLIESYCKESEYNISPDRFKNSLEMDICRLADYTGVSKHFLDYYGHLNKDERDKINDYYENRILNILNRI